MTNCYKLHFVMNYQFVKHDLVVGASIHDNDNPSAVGFGKLKEYITVVAAAAGSLLLLLKL